jgi:hypothetical protein
VRNAVPSRAAQCVRAPFADIPHAPRADVRDAARKNFLKMPISA